MSRRVQKVKILSSHPEDSYQLVRMMTNLSTLRYLINAVLSVTKYLVVRKRYCNF